MTNASITRKLFWLERPQKHYACLLYTSWKSRLNRLFAHRFALPMLCWCAALVFWLVQGAVALSLIHICIADIQTQAAFKTYWAKRLEEDPDKMCIRDSCGCFQL